MALTIRLKKEEKVKLEEISSFLCVSTSSGTIKEMISLYMPLQREKDRYEFDLHQLKSDHYDLIQCINQRSINNKRINEIVDKFISTADQDDYHL